MSSGHRWRVVALVVAGALASGIAGRAAAQEAGAAGRSDEFLAFVRAQFDAARRLETPPDGRAAWERRRQVVRRGLLDLWGGFPDEPAPLDPRVLGVLKRDGYRVEKVVFQTRPGVRMTANLYVPDRPGKHPALLMVHGHWRGAKQDPVVQARCLGAVKLGFVVLAVDAFGAGERGTGHALGEYHGEMTAATLWPVGLPLSGLQVYENMRAIDYLGSRPEVDPAHLGITGASGGGNQSMYAGAWDERVGAVVPVCSVGTYRAYLGAACCLCEVVPGAMRLAEEADVLGLVAPRSLLIVNASKDAVQFSAGEAKKTLARLEPVYRLYDQPDRLRHAVFESTHDYNRPMREAMYGWMAGALGMRAESSPIAEPEVATEDPEALRCYPGTSRPDDFMTVPRFAAREAARLLERGRLPETADAWRREVEVRREALRSRVFGGDPPPSPLQFGVSTEPGGARTLRFEPEPGLHLEARYQPGRDAKVPLAVVVDLGGAGHSEAARTLADAIRARGWGLATLDLRATGRNAWPSDAIGKAPDHNTAEWSAWIGRPLLGQWVVDLRRLLDAMERLDGGRPADVALIGVGPGGLVALSAAALDPRVTRVAAVGTLSSYITDTPYVGQRLGVMAPGILREVGDVAHLAALAAPRRVVITGGVDGAGRARSGDALRRDFAPAARGAALLGVDDTIRVLDTTAAAAVLDALHSD